MATAARPWNRGYPSRRGLDIPASKWPRPRGRGIELLILYRRVTSLASMWPRPRGRGIGVTQVGAASTYRLQCGHGRAAVESSSLSSTAGSPPSLQCVQGSAAVESRACFPPFAAAFWLHCGHGRAAVESKICVPVPLAFDPLQCGPGRAAVESSRSSCRHPSYTSFNVATAARPWNPLSKSVDRSIIWASMWSRPRGRGIVGNDG